MAFTDEVWYTVVPQLDLTGVRFEYGETRLFEEANTVFIIMKYELKRSRRSTAAAAIGVLHPDCSVSMQVPMLLGDE